MKNIDNSLKIKILAKEQSITALLPVALVAFAVAYGLFEAAANAFASVSLSPFMGAIPGLTAGLGVLLSVKKTWKYIPAVLTAILTLILLFVPILKGGTFTLYNDFATFMTVKTGRIYLPLEVSSTANSALAFLVLGCAFALLLGTAVNVNSIIPVIPVVLLATAGFIIGFLSTDIYFLVFGMGIICYIILFFSPKGQKSGNLKATAMCLALPAFCTLVAVGILLLIPANFGTELKEYITGFSHSVIYDSKTNAMPEGNLQNLGAFNKSNKTAIEVTMEKPQKLYLKGFVGEVYTEKGWKGLENSVLSGYSEDFYILHKNGYYAQNSVSNAVNAVMEIENRSLSIKNISACSKQSYIPYMIKNADFDMLKIGDVTSNLGKSYTASYIPSGLSEWYLSQVNLSEKQGKDKKVDEYLANEYIYREFVKENYLSLPKTAYTAIEKALDGKKASSPTEIISTILLFLESGAVKYDETVVTANGDRDFLTYFLEQNPRGYSVHYATAAALMLRYYGIPARYVEGYFLSDGDAAEYGENRIITLTENHAHAWCEYYLEGVGWVPFEVTPGYIDDELEKAAFSTDGESSKRYNQSELPKIDVEQDRPKDELNEAPKDYTLLIVVVIGILFFAFVAAIIFVTLGRNRLKRAIKAISEANNRQRAAMCFGYAEKLASVFDISPKTLAELGREDAMFINQEALFSPHEITDEQCKAVDEYAEKLLAEGKRNCSFKDNIKNRFIKFIY